MEEREREADIAKYGYDLGKAERQGWCLTALATCVEPGAASNSRLDLLKQLAASGDQNALMGVAELTRRKMRAGRG